MADAGSVDHPKVMVSVAVAAQRAGRDVRTVQRWVQQGRVQSYDNGDAIRMVDLRQVLQVEADIRLRHRNKQQQVLSRLLQDWQS